MYIPLSDDKHRFVRDSSLRTLEIRNNVRDNFFLTKFFFQQKNIFLGFCLRLNFVSDYIPQLYFVCNHLIEYNLPIGLHLVIDFQSQIFIRILHDCQIIEILYHTLTPQRHYYNKIKQDNQILIKQSWSDKRFLTLDIC